MNATINRDIFKHLNTNSQGFNNLCTIIHLIAAEGQYTGQVYLQGNLLGAFSLVSDASVTDTQVQIDVSTFDHVSQVNLKNQVDPNPSYSVGKGGYMLLYASGPQDGFYVTLSTNAGNTATVVFDTRDLNNGDLAIFRPVTPGSYTLTNDKGTQQASITVQSYPDHQYPNPATLNPIAANLTAAGFVPNSITLSPLQALVVTIATLASLDFSGSN